MTKEIINIVSSLTTFVAIGIWIYLSWKISLRVRYMEELHKNQTLQYDLMLTHILSNIIKDCIKSEDYEMANKIKLIVDDIGKNDSFQIEITELKTNN